MQRKGIDKRIIILGVTGMLGHKMWQKFSDRYDSIFAIIRKRKKDFDKYSFLKSDGVVESLDLCDFEKMEKVLSEIRPDIIINCAGVTPRSREAGDETATSTINSLLPHRLLAWGKQNKAKIIHFSTDCVFDGKTGNYDEKSPLNAYDLYGRTKILGEINDIDALTIRSSFIGRELDSGTELLEWLLSQHGKCVKGYRKAFFTGITTNLLADTVTDIIERFPALHGIYHISSEVISKYDFLQMIRKLYKVDVEIEPDDQFECNRSLNNEKFRQATGFECPNWPQMMATMANDPTPYDTWRIQK